MNRKILIALISIHLMVDIAAAESWQILMSDGRELRFVTLIELREDSLIISKNSKSSKIAIKNIAIVKAVDIDKSMMPLGGCFAGCVTGGILGWQVFLRSNTIEEGFNNMAVVTAVGALTGLAIGTSIADDIDFEAGTDFTRMTQEERRLHLQALMTITDTRRETDR